MKRKIPRSALRACAALILCGICGPLRADDPPPAPIDLKDGLVLPPSNRGRGRTAFPADAVEGLIVSGKWSAPKAGDEVKIGDRSIGAWKAIKAGDDGTFRDPALRGGYVFVNVPSDSDFAMTLEASGHSLVYVNGEPRAGDPYSNGNLHLPVELRKGNNEFLFAVGRGALKARLVEMKNWAYLDLADATLPNLIVGREVDTWAGVVVVNASGLEEGFVLDANLDGVHTLTRIGPIPSSSIRKVAVRVKGPAPEGEGRRTLKLSLVGLRSELDSATVDLTAKAASATRNVTFLSDIDGSVQYYGLVPAKPDPDAKGRKPGLILTLHGAGVDGGGQARVYSPKVGLHVVAPTNRRPYGFDWEDWGRLDAIEVLDHASKSLDTDPRRTYVTGHSMGGHGTWHLGVTYPDRFAAIAPSAGWVSMTSYAGVRKSQAPNPMEEILQRAAAGSDTLALAPNLESVGVYVLHGDADDNVPVSQARTMRKTLGTFHADFSYYEKVGAGHWWGNECCDWPPLIDFLAHHERPEASTIRRVEFTTASPAISASRDWATIEAQTKAFLPSAIHLRYDAEKHKLTGQAENVARLSLDLPGETLTAELDGLPAVEVQRVAGVSRFILSRDGNAWKSGEMAPIWSKTPKRCGPFKEAFRNRMIFVYGTEGTAEENAWALAKSRYDAETFAYRGNGSVDVVRDMDFNAAADPNRNVILYGNADTNGAWVSLLSASPVRVGRGAIKVGEREEHGDDLACLFVRPRPGSDSASVGVVSGTGPIGMRVTNRLPYFSSGVAYPDLVVIGSDMLEKGEAGVRCAGFFGQDWGVNGGEIVWAAEKNR
jgi:poly(3-hydroxybutyrate) depolymerase